MDIKRCPKCGGRMFLQYGTGYKGDKYEYSCLACGHTESTKSDRGSNVYGYVRNTGSR